MARAQHKHLVFSYDPVLDELGIVVIFVDIWKAGGWWKVGTLFEAKIHSCLTEPYVFRLKRN